MTAFVVLVLKFFHLIFVSEGCIGKQRHSVADNGILALRCDKQMGLMSLNFSCSIPRDPQMAGGARMLLGDMSYK